MKKLILLCVLVLSGCLPSTPPSNFYMLDSVDAENIKPISNKNYNISIDVRVPGYIDRPQIVTLGSTDTEYNISEFNRWLEGLSTAIQRVIAENISHQLPKSKIKPATIGMINPDYKVIIDIDKLDGRFNQKATLRAWITIVNSSNKVVCFDNITIEDEVGSNYNDFVQKQSSLLQKLSNEIVKQII